MEETTSSTVMVHVASRLVALRSNPNADYFALSVTNASYISATGEYIPRVRLQHGYGVPAIDQYQFPIDNTPYRIAALSPFLLNSWKGGPPVGWQPPNWTIVHEERPTCHVGFLGEAETPYPPAEVFERARQWVDTNASTA
jgi:hypothetical protein